jgi:hypothetical protein
MEQLEILVGSCYDNFHCDFLICSLKVHEKTCLAKVYIYFFRWTLGENVILP